jgi:hypothetical protein
MSFLWHGLTEEGAQVPVQVDDEGRVIAIDGSPGVGFWDRSGSTLSPVNSGDNLSNIGRASFAGTVDVGSFDLSYTDTSGAELRSSGELIVQRPESLPNGALFDGRLGATQTVNIQANGNARFDGDVVIGSRGRQWMIVESGGLAHLVEQTAFKGQLRQSYPELRNIPGELTMVEQCLQEVMERLKMVPPAGWEVWDGDESSP